MLCEQENGRTKLAGAIASDDIVFQVNDNLRDQDRDAQQVPFVHANCNPLASSFSLEPFMPVDRKLIRFGGGGGGGGLRDG